MAGDRHQKVKGIFELHKGDDSARIRVLAYKENGHYVLEDQQIIREFPPNGYVFAKNFLKSHPAFPINTLLEFSTFPNTKQSQGYDENILDQKSNCNELGMRVFKIDEILLDNPFSFNQPILKQYIPAEMLKSFYILNFGQLYGAFIYANGEVLPEKGKEVYRFTNIPQILNINGQEFLLEKPSLNGESIDCRTTAQLSIFLKSAVKKLDLPDLPPQFFELLENTDQTTLDNAILSRALRLSQTLFTTRDELRSLTNSSPNLQTHYRQFLKNLKEELRIENIDPVIEKKEQLVKECNLLSESLERIRKQVNNLESTKQKLDRDVTHLESNKNRLIDDIRLKAEITTASNIEIEKQNQDKLLTFEIQTFDFTETPFDNLASLIKTYQHILQNGTNDYRSSFFQLKNHRAILCRDVVLVQLLAKLSNNCQLYIQQAEADWLKFQHFYENGLRQCWESAWQAPDKIHLFVLEDINLSPVECYAKPILDLLSKTRRVLPGTRTEWPKNLWLFGIAVSKESDDSFGLPFQRKTYLHWGSFPAAEDILVDEIKAMENFLSVDSLLNHDALTPINNNDFFS